MSSKAKLIAFAAIFALFIALSVILYNTFKMQISPPLTVENERGEVQASENEDDKIKAPDFTVYDADRTAVKLSDMEGTPVVLNFWASWCPPCKSEMPHFDTVYAELSSEIQFMMVDLVDGARETTESGKSYIEQQGFSFPVFFDTDGEAGGIYGIRSIPTTIFIDKDGYIVTGVQGAIDEATLRKGIDLIK